VREAPLEAHLYARTSRPSLSRSIYTKMEAEDRQTVLTGLQAVRTDVQAMAQ